MWHNRNQKMYLKNLSTLTPLKEPEKKGRKRNETSKNLAVIQKNKTITKKTDSRSYLQKMMTKTAKAHQQPNQPLTSTSLTIMKQKLMKTQKTSNKRKLKSRKSCCLSFYVTKASGQQSVNTSIYNYSESSDILGWRTD